LNWALDLAAVKNVSARFLVAGDVIIRQKFAAPFAPDSPVEVHLGRMFPFNQTTGFQPMALFLRRPGGVLFVRGVLGRQATWSEVSLSERLLGNTCPRPTF